ncbi:hypothetical protein [Pseudothioclava arenosa]|uniref:Uncharacterized protein n=1 Tax=Pseudothioclava arenosa TaxID=1795308 RepID=A0A2A4CUK1_9RHOB|nr:hypothetical protein [Pseudothioclava arenosa]PCD77764.1 hypothetical protein CLN94_00090 [Pseudothioclava arenosa]
MSLRIERRSGPVFAALAILAAGFAAEIGHALASRPATQARLAEEARLVRVLGLTDIALFTEARYTRHPSQADLNTPFQDHPLAFDHFPSGSLMPAPDLPTSGRMGFSEEEFAK